ncbi:MAG: response regulator, partial [Chitinivibrionales bacterium]|nr:response regulator [Chitinivibrionales bacterium]
MKMMVSDVGRNRRIVDMPENKTAIVVNDDIAQLAFVAGVLRRNGFAVETCPSGVAGLKVLDKTGPPSVIVTDIEMPGIDGWQLCRLLRSPDYAHVNHVPIVVVSSVFTGQRPQRICADLGASAFIPVPFTAEELMEKVDAVLGGDEDAASRVRACILAGSIPTGQSIARMLPGKEYNVRVVENTTAAVDAISRHSVELVLVEDEGDDTAIELLLRAAAKHESSPVLVCVVREFDQARAASLMRRGVSAYVSLPLHEDFLRVTCERARECRAVEDVERILSRRTWELREREQWYQSVMSASTDLVYATTAEYTILYLNQAMEARIGSDSLGQHCYARLYDRREPCSFCPMDGIQQGATAGFETQLFADDESFHVSCTPLPRPDGSIALMAVLRDITETKRILQRAAVAERLEAVGQLAAGIAHDFNNML